MGNEDNGSFFVAGELGEKLNDDGAGSGVQITGGFVGKDDGGAMDEGAGYGGALELAAGKLVGTVVSAVGELNGVEEFASASTGGRVTRPARRRGRSIFSSTVRVGRR